MSTEGSSRTLRFITVVLTVCVVIAVICAFGVGSYGTAVLTPLEPEFSERVCHPDMCITVEADVKEYTFFTWVRIGVQAVVPIKGSKYTIACWDSCEQEVAGGILHAVKGELGWDFWIDEDKENGWSIERLAK